MAAWLASIAVLIVTTKAWGIGFSKGDRFQETPISGKVSITCEEGAVSKSRTFQCYDLILMPASFDFFVGPRGSGADQVQLTAVRADGSVRNKTLGYDSFQGQSTSRFNLWVKSPLQPALLNEGPNDVSYSLIKGSQEVASGRFRVEVVRGAGASCPREGSYRSGSLGDCESQFATCQKYFADTNSCTNP